MWIFLLRFRSQLENGFWAAKKANAKDKLCSKKKNRTEEEVRNFPILNTKLFLLQIFSLARYHQNLSGEFFVFADLVENLAVFFLVENPQGHGKCEPDWNEWDFCVSRAKLCFLKISMSILN